MDGAQAVENILEHYGVRGMKWGVRNVDRPSAVTTTQKGKKLKTRGGYGRQASEEAIRSRETGQVLRKSGMHALSNKELQAYTQRLNLEQQARRLDYNTTTRGRRLVLSMLGQTGKSAVETAAKEAASQQVKKGFIKAGLLEAPKIAKAAAVVA